MWGVHCGVVVIVYRWHCCSLCNSLLQKLVMLTRCKVEPIALPPRNGLMQNAKYGVTHQMNVNHLPIIVLPTTTGCHQKNFVQSVHWNTRQTIVRKQWYWVPRCALTVPTYKHISVMYGFILSIPVLLYRPWSNPTIVSEAILTNMVLHENSFVNRFTRAGVIIQTKRSIGTPYS